MKAVFPLTLCAGAIAIAFVGLEFAQPGWIRNQEPEVHNLPDSAYRMAAEDGPSERLQQRFRTVVARIRLRHDIVRDLIAERLTLLEAAARFRELDRLLPVDYADLFRQRYPSDSDAEWYCLQVIAGTDLQLSSEQSPAPIVVRLRAELQELKAGGNLRLPDGK